MDSPGVNAVQTPAEEELREKADQLGRADEVREFDAFHGSWVYRLVALRVAGQYL